jgi:hypothetical protein
MFIMHEAAQGTEPNMFQGDPQPYPIVAIPGQRKTKMNIQSLAPQQASLQVKVQAVLKHTLAGCCCCRITTPIILT